MTRNEKVLGWVYAAIAMLALVATWSNNIAFVMETGSFFLRGFVPALYVNYAAASIAHDLFSSVCRRSSLWLTKPAGWEFAMPGVYRAAWNWHPLRTISVIRLATLANGKGSGMRF